MALDLDGLILRIHAAALDPRSWSAVLEQVRVGLNGRGAILHTPWVRSFDDYWFFNAQIDPSEIETYARDWLADDVWAEGARSRGLYQTEGLICVDDVMVERRMFRRSAFFCDFLQNNDMDRMVTVNLHRGGNREAPVHTQLSVFSGVGKAAFSAADVEFLKQLQPHLLVATRNYCSLRRLLAFSATTEHALDSVAAALFATDRNGVLVHANQCGEEVLRDGGWLSSMGGQLCPGKGLANTKECSAAIRDVTGGMGSTLLLERRSTGQQRILLTSPIDRAGPLRAPVPANATALIWLLSDRPGVTAIERMARLFELTSAESRLLARLADGEEVRAAAEALGVSIHTARNQLKAILRKTGRRSQAQLLALLSRLALIVSASSAAYRP